MLAPEELFINEQDTDLYEPVALDKRDQIDLEDCDYS